MEVALDPGEKRWDQHRLVGRRVVGGEVHAYNATATPLDAYRHARVITARQFEAGNGLRIQWARAGREPHMTAHLDGTRGGGFADFITEGEVGDERDEKRTRAWKRFIRKLNRLEPIAASCAWNVCCMAQGAEAWAQRMGKPGHLGLVVLIEALDGMMGEKGGR